MDIFATLPELFEMLQDSSEELIKLRSMGVVMHIDFGAAIYQMGYAISDKMQIQFYLCGKKCTRPGCKWDSTLPKEELWAIEHEMDMSGNYMHRHCYIETEREVGHWFSSSCDKPLKEYVKELIKEVKKTYR